MKHIYINGFKIRSKRSLRTSDAINQIIMDCSMWWTSSPPFWISIAQGNWV